MDTTYQSRTLSKLTDEVWLCSGRFVGFSRAPRARLMEGLERIASIRLDVAQCSRVGSMPPVEIVPSVWQDLDGLILGQATHLTLGIQTYLGVRIPAQTAVCRDIGAVRAVLIHEFAHCFYFMKMFVDAMDDEASDRSKRQKADAGVLLNPPDEAMLINPIDWFGQKDAMDFVHAGDAKTEPIEALVPSLLSQFRSAAPESTMSVGPIYVKDEIKKHIRSLRIS